MPSTSAASSPDYFSAQATDYARYRPTYPTVLFSWLASLAPNHDLAWDCATGNGQAARALTPHFDTVVATDLSTAQLAEARLHPRIDYRTEPAEHTTLPNSSVDLVTVAQAAHWFDLPAFYREVRRVLRPRGIIALWTYTLLRVTPRIDAVIDGYYNDVVGAYWPPERRLVEARYATLRFPFHELKKPTFFFVQTWTMDDMLGYLRTWSARRQYIRAHGSDPVDQIEGPLRQVWDTDTAYPVRWELPMRIGRLR